MADGAELAEVLEVAGLIIEVNRGLIRELEGVVLGRHGLLGTDFDAMLRLRNSPGHPLRMTDLAAQVGLSASGVTKLGERLVAQGWAIRQPSACDRRSLVMTLTADGLAMCDRVAGDVRPVIERAVVAPLGADVREFIALLTRVRDTVAPEATRQSS